MNYKKKNLFLKTNTSSKNGFTLLEVVSAIFILTVGVGGAFTLIQQVLSTASLVEQRLIASHLAQEGIEIVKNLRDNAWLRKRVVGTISWDEYLPTGDWEADYFTEDLNGHPYNEGHFLNIGQNGFYTYSLPGTPTKFKRKISIEEAGIDKKKVSIEIKWEERGRTHSFKVLEYITNWYEN